MLTLPPSVHVYLAAEPADMRKSFDGLSALVAERFGRDPLCGHLFVFRNRRGDQVRILFWERTSRLHPPVQAIRAPSRSPYPYIRMPGDHYGCAGSYGGHAGRPGIGTSRLTTRTVGRCRYPLNGPTGRPRTICPPDRSLRYMRRPLSSSRWPGWWRG